jgi:hypothetical protein
MLDLFRQYYAGDVPYIVSNYHQISISILIVFMSLLMPFICLGTLATLSFLTLIPGFFYRLQNIDFREALTYEKQSFFTGLGLQSDFPQDVVPDGGLGYLRYYVPEEWVADLGALNQKLTERKKSMWLIWFRLFFHILELVWTFYIKIKIDNLWLPKDRRIDK